MVSLTYAARVSCHQRNFAVELAVIETGVKINAGPAERLSSAEVMRDRQRLIALRPPTDPATGMMHYDTPQAHEYRDALQDIVSRYGSIEEFQEAAGLPDSAAVSGPQLAPAAAPDVPNVMAGPSAEAALARFAQNMMAPAPLPGAAGVPQNAVPPGLMPHAR